MAADRRLIIVSGLSGSGKSIALHVLEDLGYYCMDNLPAALLQAAVSEVGAAEDPQSRRIAVGIDARNRHRDLESLPKLVQQFRDQDILTDVLFLQADEEVLLKRYSESRRRHPLSTHGAELRSAIEQEREILADVIDTADLIIDTSSLSVYDLADTIRERVDGRRKGAISVLIESFGYKFGIPADADFVFDLRCLPNPYWNHELRPLTGLDPKVSSFLDADNNFSAMYEDILGFLERWIPAYRDTHRGYLTIALGCTGGRHRSVCMAEKLARALRSGNEPVSVRHNQLRTLPAA
jgi:UPF0042 nucleotide-binding protein